MSPPLAPFDLSAEPSLDVLVAYAVFFVVTIAGAKLVSTLVVGAVDRRSFARSPKLRDAKRYEIGHLPRAEETLAVGYLRNRIDGVAAVLLAEALASGWLVFIGERGHLGRVPNDAGEAARALARALEIGAITRERANSAAKKVALSLEPAILADLETAGLLRSWSVRRLGEIVAVLVALPMGIIALRRVLDGALRASALGTGASQSLLVLAFEVAAFAVALAVTVAVPPETEQAHAYLAWLDEATAALRADAASGRAHRVADVMLAAALGAEPAA